MQSTRWLTTKQICAEQGVTRETIRRWHKNGWVERHALGPGTQVRWRWLTEEERAARERLTWPVNEYGEPTRPA